MTTLATPTKTLLTADDLARVPNARDYELIDGELVERTPMGNRSDWIAGELLTLLRNFLRTKPLGWVFGPESGYKCFGDQGRDLRRPDVSFVRFGRFPEEEIPEGYSKIPPDLAVEVVSPGDEAEDVEKIQQFLKGGVPLVWVVYPRSRTVHVRRADGTVTTLPLPTS